MCRVQQRVNDHFAISSFPFFERALVGTPNTEYTRKRCYVCRWRDEKYSAMNVFLSNLKIHKGMRRDKIRVGHIPPLLSPGVLAS